jgi:hypothetical protein
MTISFLHNSAPVTKHLLNVWSIPSILHGSLQIYVKLQAMGYIHHIRVRERVRGGYIERVVSKREKETEEERR